MTESWSGRSTRTSPARSSSPRSSALAREYRYLGSTASHSRIAAEPPSPQMQAWASLVTGLVTPTVEKSAPEIWLNSEDFPLPVPPARTTTGWLHEGRVPPPAPRRNYFATVQDF